MNLDRSKYIANGRLNLLQTPTYNAKSISSSIFEINYLNSDNILAKSLSSSQKVECKTIADIFGWMYSIFIENKVLPALRRFGDLERNALRKIRVD